MEATSGGMSSLFQSTKTKLLVLSSLLGVGAIYYMTRNYLRKGYLLPSWRAQKSIDQKDGSYKHPRVIGGKRAVSIREDDSIGHTSSSFRKQRSRRSSVSSRSSRVSKRHSTLKPAAASTNIDVELTNAITELDTSIHEIEEILKLRHHRDNRPLNGDVNSNIQQEISRLRRLVDYAQDSKSVIEKTQEFISKQKQVIDEDIAEVSAVNELNNENYEELVTFLRNQKAFNSDDDYNSDEESFISATESVEYQLEEGQYSLDSIYFRESIKDAVSKHNKQDFYMQGIEYLTQYGVPVRAVRTDFLKCDNDIDFCVKVHCLRKAFKDLLDKEEMREWFINSGKEILITFLTKTNTDSDRFSNDFDEMMRYCEESKHWTTIEEELSGRGVCCLNFYDIVLDFIIMDSFEDLSNPPSSVMAVVQNRWLSLRIKETALSTAIWTVIKGKKRMLKHTNGFYSRFYDISMHITPVLAWGFLGPVKELNELCKGFKNSIVGFLQDIFSTEKANYKSVQTLAEDIFKHANRRKDELMTLIT